MNSSRQELFESSSIPKAFFALTIPTVISLSRQGVVYLAVIIIANMLFGYSGVIAAQPAADFLSAVLAIFLLAKSLGKEWRTS